MRIRKFRYLFTLLMLVVIQFVQAQDRFAGIEQKLTELARTTPGLNNKVEYSVDNVSIQELISGLAVSNNLNINVDNSLVTLVNNNFSGVTVSEVILFLCKKYDLEINFIGSIMSVMKYTAPVEEKPKPKTKEIKLSYDKAADRISFDLTNDSLPVFTKAFTKATGKNIIYSPDMGTKLLNGFLQDMPLITAFEKLAFANNFKVNYADDSYIIEKIDPAAQTQTGSAKKNDKKNSPKDVQGLELKINNGLITANANNIPIADVIAMASGEIKNNYFYFSEIKGNISMNVVDKTYEDFLKYVLNGTTYTFKTENNIYLFGERTMEGLRSTKVVSLKYRTVDKVVDFIPPDMKKEVDIKTFPDLNSIILSGSQPRIDEIESFLRDIDKVVPVIVIEVIIAQIKKSSSVATGIEAGISQTPKTTQGTVFPGVDMTLSAGSINNLISGLNGFGGINLGNVTPNFYITLKALEANGYLKLHSTPKLSTLNGNKATMSIGQTAYYLETTNNIIGTQNPQNQVTQQYKSVDASLSLIILPMVSGDEQITLDINVKQSSFTDRISPSAPPGKITRDFQSLLRVKNGDMIILGGLDENSISDTGSGVPLLARVPVIKWLFSSRTRARSKDKLTVFIKPTVIY